MPTDKYWDEVNNVWQKIGVSPSDLSDLAGEGRTTETIKGNTDTLATHKAETMPHKFADGTKTYRWGLKVVNGVVTMQYEEVL